MTGVCQCGHVDGVHFDEVLHCGACPCERFWDRSPAPVTEEDVSAAREKRDAARKTFREVWASGAPAAEAARLESEADAEYRRLRHRRELRL